MAKRPTCIHADVPTDKLGRRIMRNNKAYRCAIEIPLPACISKVYGFRWPPMRNYVMASDCETCPTRQDPEKEN